MADGELVLAIDQGTSGSKAILVRGDGTVVARGSHAIRRTHPAPGWVEQSADEVWASVVKAVDACLTGLNPRVVAAVGVSNQRESLLLWDRATGDAASPILSWQDQRTAARCAELTAQGHGDLVRDRTGLPLDPMFSAAKGEWLLDHVDPDRRRARAGELCLGTIDSWLLSRFGGDHLVEVGNAARTQLCNIHTTDWDPDLLTLFRIPEQVMPRVVPSTGPFPAVTGLAPLPSGVPVTAVLADSHAALFAYGGTGTGHVKATYGTGSSVMGLCTPDDPVGTTLCRTVAWATDRVHYAVEGNIRSSGSTLSWLADLVGRTPQELADLAATADSAGVHLVPAFSGLGAPWWDAQARASITGLTFGAALPQLARAALESVAFQIEDVVAEVDAAAGHVETVLADGGASRNAGLMQLQADISGRRVRRSGVPDLSALGVALLAGSAVGHPAVGDATADAGEDFHPTTTRAERHARTTAWHAAVAAVRTSPTVPPHRR
ncbi:FGGY family carbohydrate kinase [Micromonospora sp. BQ11]|uniref:FGGY family carbohydrate kinase n=1 Tax=Micromonospora sp. BQ11 TaxID=3452212 RepID=UPI003F8A9FC1